MIHSACVSRLAAAVPGAFEFTEAVQPLLLQAQFVSRLCGIVVTPTTEGEDDDDIRRRMATARKKRKQLPLHFDVPTGMALIRHILETSRFVGHQDIHLVTVSILKAALKPYFK